MRRDPTLFSLHWNHLQLLADLTKISPIVATRNLTDLTQFPWPRRINSGLFILKTNIILRHNNLFLLGKRLGLTMEL